MISFTINMVLLGLPEPPREPYDEDLSMGEAGQNVIIVNTSSDSEDERDNAGYELLPMEGNDIPDSDCEDSNGEESLDETKESTEECEGKLFTATFDEPGTSSDIKHIWSAPREAPNIVMDAAHMNQVKAAMASFSLPASAIPPWAVEVTEDRWKDALLDKLKNLQDRKAGK